MICPFRKMTETVDGTTREYYMDCYGKECPCYGSTFVIRSDGSRGEESYCIRAENAGWTLHD